MDRIIYVLSSIADEEENEQTLGKLSSLQKHVTDGLYKWNICIPPASGLSSISASSTKINESLNSMSTKMWKNYRKKKRSSLP